MKTKLLLGLALVFSGSLFAGEQTTHSLPTQPANLWIHINYPSPQNWSNTPDFLISSGEEYQQVSRGLRLDILNVVQGFGFFKTNAITAQLYRADGEIIEPTAEGKKLLNAPISVSTASFFGAMPAPQVMTYFPWGTNALEESWIKITIGAERYWLEIPYGFDQKPNVPLSPPVAGGPPKFMPAEKSFTQHDHLVRWQNVEYDLGAIQNHWRLTLKQSNPFDAESEIVLYHDPDQAAKSNWNLFSPKTAVRIWDADGTAITGQCVNLHLNDDALRRTDTFEWFDRGADDKRCWGQIEISVAEQTYRATIPSSLYKYVHGHARDDLNP